MASDFANACAWRRVIVSVGEKDLSSRATAAVNADKNVLNGAAALVRSAVVLLYILV